MLSLFKNKIFKIKKQSIGTSGKPKAIVFVDFEHWYISLDRNFHTRPDIRAWRNEISESYEIQEIVFFADFANLSLKAEIPKIREITNYIIETQNVSSNFKKDFTDFIMLDHIYQKAMNSPEIGTFILFTGDGHFSSVVSFLTTQLNKEVGIYGIKDSISNQLKNSASWCVVLPKSVDPMQAYYTMILKNLKYLKDVEKEGKKVIPTFSATVKVVSQINHVRMSQVNEAMRSLIDKGYLFQTEEKLHQGKTVKKLNVNWDKCIKDKLIESV